MDFTLAVKSQQGQVLTTPETIAPRQKLAIDLASLITQLGGDPTGAFAQGSASIYFVGTITDPSSARSPPPTRNGAGWHQSAWWSMYLGAVIFRLS